MNPHVNKRRWREGLSADLPDQKPGVHFMFLFTEFPPTLSLSPTTKIFCLLCYKDMEIIRTWILKCHYGTCVIMQRDITNGKGQKTGGKTSPNSPEFVVLGIVIFKRINIIQVPSKLVRRQPTGRPFIPTCHLSILCPSSLMTPGGYQLQALHMLSEFFITEPHCSFLCNKTQCFAKLPGIMNYTAQASSNDGLSSPSSLEPVFLASTTTLGLISMTEGICSLAGAGSSLTIKTRLAMNSQRYTGLGLPSAGIKCMHHQEV